MPCDGTAGSTAACNTAKPAPFFECRVDTQWTTNTCCYASSIVDNPQYSYVTCAENEYVRNNRCEPCPPGSTNAAGDNVFEGDTTCVTQRPCSDVNWRGEWNGDPMGPVLLMECDLVDNNCTMPYKCELDTRWATTPCCFPDYTMGLANEQIQLMDVPCWESTYVHNTFCEKCPQGYTNPAGDNPAGGDTACILQSSQDVTCAENEYVRNNRCEPCPPGSTNAAGDDALQGDTACAFPYVADKQRLCSDVVFKGEFEGATLNVAPLMDCDGGVGNPEVCMNVPFLRCSLDTELADGACCFPLPTHVTNVRYSRTTCAENEYVRDTFCEPCPAGSTNAAGDRLEDGDTACAVPCGDIMLKGTYMGSSLGPAPLTSCDGTTGSSASCNDPGLPAALFECRVDTQWTTNTCCYTSSIVDNPQYSYVTCAENEYAYEDFCESCPAGFTNPAGDLVFDGDTNCERRKEQ